jgi:hypothetical protein
MSEDRAASQNASVSPNGPKWYDYTSLAAAVAAMVAAVAAALAAFSANEIAQSNLQLERSAARPIVEIESVGGRAFQSGSLLISFRLKNRGQTAARVESGILTISAYNDGEKTVPLDEPTYLVLIGPVDNEEVLAGEEMPRTHSTNFPPALDRISDAKSFIGEFEIYYSFPDELASDESFSEAATGELEVQPR